MRWRHTFTSSLNSLAVITNGDVPSTLCVAIRCSGAKEQCSKFSLLCVGRLSLLTLHLKELHEHAAAATPSRRHVGPTREQLVGGIDRASNKGGLQAQA
eukprot:scaffold2723_cov108-Isochrysis_galbana.AAC.2